MFTRLGDAYRNIGDLVAAETNYRQALDKGDRKYGLLGLARVHAIRGELDEVVICYRQLVVNDEEDGWLFGEIAAQLIAHRKQSDAESFYRIACELQQDKQNVLRELALHAEKLGLR